MSLTIGAAGALFGVVVGLPLPYMLGPLLFGALAAFAGAPLLMFPYGREMGQVVVGIGIGLRFTPVVVVATLKLLPVMLLSTVLIMITTTGAALLMRRLAQVDRTTAFFSTAAAGIIEMAVIATQKGADSSIVAVTHLVRVTTIVATVPILVTLFGTHGHLQQAHIPFDTEAIPLIGLLLVAGALGYLIAPLRIPNTWLMVPVLLGALVAGLGFGPYAIPRILLTVAQVVIGTWIGSRFRRDVLTRLPRITITALIITFYLIVSAMVIATIVVALSDLSFTTAVLAVAPAGITEMVLTATAMHLDAATVTAFQIMRIAVVMTTIQFTFAAFDKLSEKFATQDRHSNESE
ncbi:MULTISPECIES: AbrB family transcriptional regulator [Mesorhizobium]